MSTVPRNSDDKKEKDKANCFVLHRFLLITILPSIITMICYHYAKHMSKQKAIGTIKMGKNKWI